MPGPLALLDEVTAEIGEGLLPLSVGVDAAGPVPESEDFLGENAGHEADFAQDAEGEHGQPWVAGATLRRRT